MKIVLQKFIAESGLCSRRKAEEMIRRFIETRRGASIVVNGKPAELGMMVDENDDVRIGKQKIVLANKKNYIILNKPKSYICTNRKFIGEKNIFDLISIKEKLFVAGRLDKDSRGLILLTNDGELTQKLTHPKFEHEKKYIVAVKNYELSFNSAQRRQITKNELVDVLKKGINIGEGDGVVRVRSIKKLGEDKFEIILTEGKKRQIRRMFEAVGYEVVDLVRTEIGNLQLGELSVGKWRHLNDKEIKLLNG